MEQLIEGFRFDTRKRFFFGDQTFIDHINGYFQRCLSGTLAVSCLKHEQTAVVDREFHILHIAVMVFKSLRGSCELFVYFRHVVLQAADFFRRTDAGNDVFALCVDQIFAVQLAFACSRVSCERNACTGVVAHVPEDHALYVNGCAVIMRDFVEVSVNNGSRIVPGSEDRFDGHHQLFFRFCREISASFLFNDFFIAGNQFFQVFDGQFGVDLIAFSVLNFIEDVFKLVLFDFLYDVRKHLDESAVAVPCEARIVRLS